MERPVCPVCDFCMSTDVQWTHPPKDDTRETQEAGSEKVGNLTHICNSSAWAACPPCSTLVESNDISALAHRAAREGLKGMGLSPSEREVTKYAGALVKKYTAVLPVLGPRRKPNDDDLASHKKGFRFEPL